MPHKKFLEEYSLYRKFKVDRLPPTTDQLSAVQINMECSKCNSNQTFVMTNKYYENCDYTNFPVGGIVFRMVYLCVHCQEFERIFYVLAKVSMQSPTRSVWNMRKLAVKFWFSWSIRLLQARLPRKSLPQVWESCLKRKARKEANNRITSIKKRCSFLALFLMLVMQNVMPLSLRSGTVASLTDGIQEFF